MKINNSELTEFFEQLIILRKLPILQIFSRTVRELNLSESQFMALVKIALEPEGAFVSSVANQLLIDRPRASRIVDSLEKANLVQRIYAKLSDRRKIQLMPTNEGTELIIKIREESMQTAREIFEAIGEQPRELNDSLNAFNKVILSRMELLKDE